MNIYNIDGKNRPFFEVRNHDLNVDPNTCTPGVNIPDFENFLRTIYHLGTQVVTQYIEILNDQYIYPITKKNCSAYQIL